MNYQPFLIADLKTGLDLGMEPWLLPKDAFTVLQDAFVYQGVLQKRKGQSLFAVTATQEGTAITGIMPVVNATTGTENLLVADIDWLYLYNSDTGFLSKLSHSTDTTEAVVFEDTDGCEFTDTAGCVFTTTYHYGENFSGDSTALINWQNWDGTIYLTNDTDNIQSYDGSTYQDLTPDTGGGNTVTKCAHIMLNKERLILFNTDESGDGREAQRARWCKAGDPTDWTNDGYVDAPTSEWIRGASYFKDDILVWFDKSVWLLRYTGNSDLPFRWEKISGLDGCSAPFSAVEFQGAGTALGKDGPVFCDGMNVQKTDAKIPGLSLSFATEYIETCYSAVLEDLKQLWILHPSAGATAPDKALVFQYQDFAWSIYNLALQCIGFYEVSQTVRWSDLTEAWEANTLSWVSSASQSGYPVALGGDATGSVWKLNDTGTDVTSSDIGFEVKTGRWNPFKEQGQKARLGYVDFLVTTGAYSLDVEFLHDMAGSSVSGVIDFDQDGEKAWVRIFVNTIGNFHQIRLSHSESNQPIEIHAIMPWFAPAGRMLI